ncbi:metallophosphoesterase [Dielma fastidiosa]|uniref:metallophosphoesterase n=1 Tax=Dielma fastidiosa TaxID=1034346 RepID=UPI000E5437FA|nr:metallophosphoesterase [Dielma fastidiosa]RHN00843.1 metallophosphoesterase [Dielma fastidiosa]
MKKKLMIIGIIFLLIAAYALFIEGKMLKIYTYELNKTEKNQPSFKVIQLSDIHLSDSFTLDDLARLTAKVNEQKPDLVVFTGDLVDHFASFDYLDEIAPILADINAPLGRYAIWGNHDYGGGGVRYYEQIMNDAGFTLLQNSGELIPLNDQHTLWLAGLDDGLLGDPDLSLIPAADADYNILLLHEPDLADTGSTKGYQLLLSGHSHGGQISLPFFIPFTPPLARHYKRGFYDMNDQTAKHYVNAGIGTTKLPIRFMNPPQIAVFTIYL